MTYAPQTEVSARRVLFGEKLFPPSEGAIN